MVCQLYLILAKINRTVLHKLDPELLPQLCSRALKPVAELLGKLIFEDGLAACEAALKKQSGPSAKQHYKDARVHITDVPSIRAAMLMQQNSLKKEPMPSSVSLRSSFHWRS